MTVPFIKRARERIKMEMFLVFLVCCVLLLCAVFAVVAWCCEFVDWVDRKRFFSKRRDTLYIQDNEEDK